MREVEVHENKNHISFMVSYLLWRKLFVDCAVLPCNLGEVLWCTVLHCVSLFVCVNRAQDRFICIRQ